MVLLMVTILTVPASASIRVLSAEVEVNAPIEKAWRARTTPEGIKSFFAPDCKVDLRVDGAYEVYFSSDAKPGERGSEGMRILALEPMRRFAFTWSAPPIMPYVRAQRDMIMLEFEKKDEHRTLVRVTHLGWGDGAKWDEAYDYFDHAWNEVVLPRFRYSMEVGAVNWAKPPKLPPVATTLKANLTQQ